MSRWSVVLLLVAIGCNDSGSNNSGMVAVGGTTAAVGGATASGTGGMTAVTGGAGGMLGVTGGMGGAAGVAAGAGGMAGMAAGSGGAAGTAGTGGSGAGDTTLFEPDIPVSYDGPILEPGIEVVAFTIREDGGLGGPEWLVAIKNVSTNHLCSLTFAAVFYDASDAEIGKADGLVESPMHRGVSGTGDLLQCLGPDQIGMRQDNYSLMGVDANAIASMKWSVSAINLLDAVPSEDILVTGVHQTMDSFGRNQFEGTLENHSGGPVTFPEVSIFGVNGVGRPLVYAHEIEETTVSDEGSWNFTASPGFEETILDYVAFPDVNDN